MAFFPDITLEILLSQQSINKLPTPPPSPVSPQKPLSPLEPKDLLCIPHAIFKQSLAIRLPHSLSVFVQRGAGWPLTVLFLSLLLLFQHELSLQFAEPEICIHFMQCIIDVGVCLILADED